MSTIPIEDLIRRVPIFAQITVTQAQKLAQGARKEKVKRGEAIVTQDQRSKELYIILSGRAKVISINPKTGREVIIAVLQSGDSIGEMSIIDQRTHSATVIADMKSDVLIVDGELFSSLIQEDSNASRAVMVALVQRLRTADKKIGSLALLDVYGRVAHALLELSKLINGQRVISGKISRQEVAKMIGASREMVSRVMKDLEEQGFLREEIGQTILLEKTLFGSLY